VENGNNKEGISEFGKKSWVIKETRMPMKCPGLSGLDQISSVAVFLWTQA